MRGFLIGAMTAVAMTGTASANAHADDIVFKGIGISAGELAADFFIADQNGNMVIIPSWQNYSIPYTGEMAVSCEKLIKYGPAAAVKDIGSFLKDDYTPEQIKQFKPSIVDSAKKAIDACQPQLM